LISDKTSGDAIKITGTSSNDYGVVFNYNSPKEILATGGGNISISGTAGANVGVFLQNQDILATSGTITVDGGTRGVRILGSGARFGAKAGSQIVSSNSNVILSGDVITADALISGFSTNVTTSGNLTIQPAGSSFTSALTFPITNLSLANTVSGLTLGKSTNTQNITIDFSVAIDGPITVYGGAINVNQNLNTAGGALAGDILLKSSGDITLAASRSITTAGGDVILWANSDNAATNGSISLRNGSSITTGSGSVAGGSVWLGGGADGATWNGLAVGAGYAVPGTSFTPSNGGGTAIRFSLVN
jgi:hypothetical protein